MAQKNGFFYGCPIHRLVRKAPADLFKGGKQRRVAAYARVSTASDEQLNSVEAQKDYFAKLIRQRPDWTFVDVYADEGITGTSINRREAFNRMVADALAGNVDLIVTKSISRFARNTVDTLNTIRQLKAANVEVFFEKENIYTIPDVQRAANLLPHSLLQPGKNSEMYCAGV